MLSKSSQANPNYVATIVKLQGLRKHENADKLQVCNVLGTTVVTGLDAKDGDICVFFPLECALSQEFLSWTNSFRHQEKNRDTTIRGFFDDSGRVRCQKFRGQKSEGFVLPFAEIASFAQSELIPPDLGTDFDMVGDHLLVRKYEVPARTPSERVGSSKQPKISRLVPDQFRFHPDTENLRRYCSIISPEDRVVVTYKQHGTSVILANLPVYRKLTWKDRLGRILGARISNTEYDLLYSSRKVVKNDYLVKSTHFYGENLWKDVADRHGNAVPKGWSVYGEIVGYTLTGREIQKGYDYGCAPNEWQMYVYKVTFTNPDGLVWVLSWDDMVEFCAQKNLMTVPFLARGKARDFMTTDDPESLIQGLESRFLGGKCHMCKNSVPAEGIVLRRDVPRKFEVWKLKSYPFLERETKMLDAGEADVETISP